MVKERPLSEIAQKALDFLKNAEKPMTLQEIKDGLNENVNASQLGALVNRGLVNAEKVVIEVPTVAKRKVNAYMAVETDETDADETE